MQREPEIENRSLINIAHLVDCTEAEGPGRRFAIWFQGCPLRCPGCCNPEMLSFEGGESLPRREVVQRMQTVAREQNIEGITLLGGEPFAHAASGAMLAREARSLDLSVMIFSGFVLEDVQDNPDPNTQELLGLTDLLVDGPYLRDQPDRARRWIGSANQRIHFLTNRYREDDPCWRSPNTLEIRLTGPELTVNGFPADSAVGLWKRSPADKHRKGKAI
ncbi:MAG: radical SAM protein [Planctomycetales bacterium]